MGMQRAAMSGGAVTSEMTREERKLVAAVERFQKLEEDRQGTQERMSTGAGEVRKRTAADAPEAHHERKGVQDHEPVHHGIAEDHPAIRHRRLTLPGWGR